MKNDIDSLINLMQKYTIPNVEAELGEQETPDAAPAAGGASSGGGKKNNVTTWSGIVGSKLNRSGPAAPITNAPRPDRVNRSGPANQLT